MTDPRSNPLWQHTATRDNGAGFCATREGHMSLLTPLTPRASAWLRDNVGEEATWVGDALFVEDRFWPDLVDGVIAAGFTFERDEMPN